MTRDFAKYWRKGRRKTTLARVAAAGRAGRTRAAWAFPDGKKSTLMLAAAKLRRPAGTKWVTQHYRDLNRLAEAHEAA